MPWFAALLNCDQSGKRSTARSGLQGNDLPGRRFIPVIPPSWMMPANKIVIASPD
jgi:hypothetical protein